MDTKKAIEFIKKNARPVELAEFACHFENGPRQALVDALKPYQNPDGGFGHALEPDNWNPRSTPITTNTAIHSLFEAGALPAAREMGIARYLLSGDSFDSERQRWLFSVDSNKDHPHAIWWERGENDVPGWNPTVSLAAFLVCMGAEGPWEELVRQAFAELPGLSGGDELKCYILAWNMLKECEIKNVIDFAQTQKELQAQAVKSVCPHVEKYGIEYVTTPSWFLQSEAPINKDGLEPLIQAELASLQKLQLEDGGFDISWQWCTPYQEEFQQARAWWRPKVTMEKLRFYLLASK